MGYPRNRLDRTVRGGVVRPGGGRKVAGERAEKETVGGWGRFADSERSDAARKGWEFEEVEVDAPSWFLPESIKALVRRSSEWYRGHAVYLTAGSSVVSYGLGELSWT